MRTNLFEPENADAALKLLKEGNRRYMQNMKAWQDCKTAREQLAAKGQKPYAVILGCSDSRVSPEIIFDEGLGQLFVVRTAGNVCDAVAAGSVEYAAEHLGSRLVVVLGHEKCGAVKAAVDGGDAGPNIGAIISQIQPSLELVRSKYQDDVACRCEDENILHTMSRLADSKILRRLEEKEGLRIVGAKYLIETGEVVFL